MFSKSDPQSRLDQIILFLDERSLMQILNYDGDILVIIIIENYNRLCSENETWNLGRCLGIPKHLFFTYDHTFFLPSALESQNKIAKSFGIDSEL